MTSPMLLNYTHWLSVNKLMSHHLMFLYSVAQKHSSDPHFNVLIVLLCFSVCHLVSFKMNGNCSAGREVNISQREKLEKNVVVYCISVQVHGLCFCVCACVCAEGIGGRGSVGRQSWEGHHCLITAMLVTSSWRWLCSLPLCLGVIQDSVLQKQTGHCSLLR